MEEPLSVRVPRFLCVTSFASFLKKLTCGAAAEAWLTVGDAGVPEKCAILIGSSPGLCTASV